MLAAGLRRRGEPQQLTLRDAAGNDFRYRRLALGHRPGLVQNERIEPMRALERLRVANENAGLRGHAGTDHERRRRGEAERARAGDDQHRHRCNESGGEFAGNEPPSEKRRHRDGQDYRDEDPGDPVDEMLHRSLLGLRAFDERDDPRQCRFVADRRRLEAQQSVTVDGAAGHLVSRHFRNRQAFARQQALIDFAVPTDHDTIDRKPLAGPHHHDITDRHGIRGNLDLLVPTDDARPLRPQRQQRFDLRRGGALGARFQPLAGGDQRDHHGRGVEVETASRPSAPAAGRGCRSKLRRCRAPPADPCSPCAPEPPSRRRRRTARR